MLLPRHRKESLKRPYLASLWAPREGPGGWTPECQRPLASCREEAPEASSPAFPQPEAADSHPHPGPLPSQLCHTGWTGLPGPVLPRAPLSPLALAPGASAEADSRPPSAEHGWTHRKGEGTQRGRWHQVGAGGLSSQRLHHTWAHQGPRLQDPGRCRGFPACGRPPVAPRS